MRRGAKILASHGRRERLALSLRIACGISEQTGSIACGISEETGRDSPLKTKNGSARIARIWTVGVARRRGPGPAGTAPGPGRLGSDLPAPLGLCMVRKGPGLGGFECYGPDRLGFYGTIRDVLRARRMCGLQVRCRRAAGPSGRRTGDADTHGRTWRPRAPAACSRSHEPTAWASEWDRWSLRTAGAGPDKLGCALRRHPGPKGLTRVKTGRRRSLPRAGP